MNDFLPTAPHETTDQMSPTHSAVPMGILPIVSATVSHTPLPPAPHTVVRPLGDYGPLVFPSVFVTSDILLKREEGDGVCSQSVAAITELLQCVVQGTALHV